jgi:dissimilatory sulfite reductase (desulfoviridin) alpha/beta subunit
MKTMQTIHHHQDKCDFCGTCVAVCPHDAIELEESALSIIKSKCTFCMNCIFICPIRALEVKDEN